MRKSESFAHRAFRIRVLACCGLAWVLGCGQQGEADKHASSDGPGSPSLDSAHSLAAQNSTIEADSAETAIADEPQPFSPNTPLAWKPFGSLVLPQGYPWKKSLTWNGGAGRVQAHVEQAPPGFRLEGRQFHWQPSDTGQFSVAFRLVDSVDSLPLGFNLQVVPALLPRLDFRADTVPVGASVAADVAASQPAPGLPGPVRWLLMWEDAAPSAIDTLDWNGARSASLPVEKGGTRNLCALFIEPNARTHRLCRPVTGLWPLKISVTLPDTVEPGQAVQAKVHVEGDTAGLRLSWDADGDGKPEWQGTRSGKFTFTAPRSGRWSGVGLALNGSRQQGEARVGYVANARASVELKVRSEKRNLVQAVELRLRLRDLDDGLDSVWVRFSGWSEGDTAFLLASPANREARLYFERLPGKPGAYKVEACAAGVDGRLACSRTGFEVFNAPPRIDLAATLKAVVGEPTPLPRQGQDPDGSIALWEWDMDGDGRYELRARPDAEAPRYTFAAEGEFSMFLRVVSADGMSAREERRIVVTRRSVP